MKEVINAIKLKKKNFRDQEKYHGNGIKMSIKRLECHIKEVFNKLENKELQNRTKKI